MLKRIFDIVVASLVLVLLAPVLVVVYWRVRTRLGSPALFTQLRPGRAGRPFRMIKFRTMTDARAADGTLLSDAERLTRWARCCARAASTSFPSSGTSSAAT